MRPVNQYTFFWRSPGWCALLCSALKGGVYLINGLGMLQESASRRWVQNVFTQTGEWRKNSYTRQAQMVLAEFFLGFQVAQQASDQIP